MGKTTTLQAVVFALAGGAHEDIEIDRRARWDVKHFRQVVDRDKETEIQVGFDLGDTRIVVRRGIRTDSVLGFRLARDAWVHGNGDINEQYERIVVENGGYEAFDDFRYLVHRVAYLPETRQTLIWDHKAQIRAVMLICSDPERENRYRTLSRRLRDIDTEKRHLHVDIGRLEKRIEGQSAAKPVRRGPGQLEMEAIHRASEEVGKALEDILRRRSKLLARAGVFRSDLFSTNQNLEKLHEKLASTEDAFVLKLLKGVEAAQGIALQKLLVYHLCPYCSQKSDALAEEASTSVNDGNCPICHQGLEGAAQPENIRQLRADIAQLNKQQELTSKDYENFQKELNELNEQEFRLRVELDELSGKLPRVRKDLPETASQDLSSSRRALKLYQARHADLEVLWQKVKRQLDLQFRQFTELSAARLRALQEQASDYAHAFLGHECEFVPVRAKGELGTVSFLVPRFGGKERPSAESCSESERFFLDIGFRMALMDLAGTLSESHSTFICETPENALDLAYTENVAKMFGQFVRKGFSLLLTANIQFGGVAGPLLSRYIPSQRHKRVFNLLKAGSLSEIQEKKMPEFDRELKKILTAT
jgi:hypothetical protein